MKKYLFLPIVFFMLLSCKKTIYNPNLPKTKYNRNVLVIVEANNNLIDEALNSINALEQGALGIDGILLVYIKTSSAKSYLLKIRHDNDSYKIVSDTVKTFSPVGSTTPADLGEIIKYVQAEYQANSYGLVLWSHATSWAPPVIPKTKAFGNDAGVEMDVLELKEAIPNNFEFIIFDACNMGSIEILYEFRDKAKYIIASPTETVAESFPYQQIAPLLFKNADHFKKIAEVYVNYYRSYSGSRQSATVSLINTGALNSLARETKNLFIQNKTFGQDLIKLNVQRLDFTSNFPVPTYDFGDFLNKNFGTAQLSALSNQLNDLVLFKDNTANFLGKQINTFSGLSCYIPAKEDLLLAYYKRFAWYRDCGLSVLFEN